MCLSLCEPVLRDATAELVVLRDRRGEDVTHADPVQVAHLAQEVELAGGDIRNIVLAAAYDAVAAGELVGMRHVLAATVAEHHKLGRRVPEHGFAQ